MNKSEFVSYIADENDCTKAEAERIVSIFTDSVIKVLGQKDSKGISLVGFGNFSVSDVKARTGRNPRTGEAIKIGAYKQPKFKVGQKLKDACNSK